MRSFFSVLFAAGLPSLTAGVSEGAGSDDASGALRTEEVLARLDVRHQ